MFSNGTVALLFAIGVSGWIYAQMHRRTGGNNRSALMVAGVGGLFAFLTLLTLLNFIS